ncbi:MAG: methyltransferase domain-containing protein [Deltaproteobacteria bacterium]|nr:methyltransferase domain-containing protein [Deltaproteobacteria bacterium]
MAEGYLHGFTSAEQQRLLEQADFLAPWVFDGLPLPARGRLLEVGAGVGAETRHLLQRTTAQITTVEFDARQLELQHKILAGPIAEKRVLPLRADARAMPLEPDSFDGAFICWVLEHVPGPDAVLRDVLRVLKPGATVCIAEVHNQSFTLLPRDERLMEFWAAVNQTQVSLGGDPYVGARLGGLLSGAGYTDSSIRFVPVQGDQRDPKRRAEILGYFNRLLRSAVPAVAATQVKPEAELHGVLDAAFGRALAEPDSVFLYTFARATARKPEHP